MDKNTKMVVKNSMYVYVLNFFCTIIPTFTIPYVTRILGPEGYGKFSVAFNIVNYFQVLVEYGFSLYGSRKIAIAKNPKEINECFSVIFISRILLCTISLVLISIYSIIFFNQNLKGCIAILFLMVVGSMFQQNWIFQGLQKMQYITFISIISRIISIILIFMLVKDEKDVYLYCLFYALTNLLVGISGFLIVIKKLKICFVKVKYAQIINELKEAGYIFMSILGAKVVSSFGITILGIFDTEHNVGIYSAIYKISNVIVMMFSPISQALYPYNSKKFMHSMEDGFTAALKIAVPVVLFFGFISAGIAIFSGPIVKMVFGYEYLQYHVTLKILMIWIVFSVINNFLGIQILTASNNSRQYGKSFSASVVISVVVNIVLVRYLSIYGAAIAVFISESSLTGMLIVQIVKLFNRREMNYDKKIF